MRILIVDDHELIRRGIRSVLASDPTLAICGEAVDGNDAVQKANALRPDIVLMDISLPAISGLEATRKIKFNLPETEILIVSQHDSPEMVRQALDAGARGYVVKSAISTDLLSAIAKVSQHEAFVQAAALAQRNQTLHAQRKSAWGALTETISGNGNPPEVRAKGPDLIDSRFNAVIVTGVDNRIVYWNKGAEELYGWAHHEAVGQGIHVLLQTEFPEPLASISATLKCDQRWLGELVHSCKNAERLTVLSRWVLTRDPETNLESIMEVNVDISQTKEAQRQLHLLVHNLEAQVAERTLDLENATGKLTQLSGKLLQTQDEERRRIARELHDGVGQLLVALNMNFSKLVREKAQLSPAASQSLDDNISLIGQASQEIRTLSHLLHPPLLDEVGLESALHWYVEGFAERSKIAVSLQLAPGFSSGLPRELALSVFRIVQECLTNVHRHSRSQTVFVGVARSDNDVTLEIKDEGIGIPPELQSQISAGASPGVGLRGLRERIRQFDGRLKITSDRNGTRINTVLPIGGLAENKLSGTKSDDPANSPQPIEDASQNRPAILCIDDEEMSLLPRKLLLESAGHRVLEARSGAEGIRIFQSERISAVILDYWMAGMKGTTVASELKRMNPTVPIIVLSGMADLPGEAAGVVDQWIVKGSIRGEQLLKSIEALLKGRSSQSV